MRDRGPKWAKCRIWNKLKRNLTLVMRVKSHLRRTLLLLNLNSKNRSRIKKLRKNKQKKRRNNRKYLLFVFFIDKFCSL